MKDGGIGGEKIGMKRFAGGKRIARRGDGFDEEDRGADLISASSLSLRCRSCSEAPAIVGQRREGGRESEIEGDEYD